MEDPAAVGVGDRVADVEEPPQQLAELQRPLARVAPGRSSWWNASMASLRLSRTNRMALKKDPGRRSLELRQLLRRFLDVCNAIAYAHSRGVLHRDLKPDNIMVGQYGETLVVDWGLAKALGRRRRRRRPGRAAAPAARPAGRPRRCPARPSGTPAYMSPEQAAGDSTGSGPASDVYGLGATLYCLLTGRPRSRGGEPPSPGEGPAGRVPAAPAVHPASTVAGGVCLKAMAPARGRFLRPGPSPRTSTVVADEPPASRWRRLTHSTGTGSRSGWRPRAWRSWRPSRPRWRRARNARGAGADAGPVEAGPRTKEAIEHRSLTASLAVERGMAVADARLNRALLTLAGGLGRPRPRAGAPASSRTGLARASPDDGRRSRPCSIRGARPTAWRSARREARPGGGDRDGTASGGSTGPGPGRSRTSRIRGA